MRRAFSFIGCLGALSLITAVATTATTDQELSTQQELNAEATPPRPLLDTFGARIARGFEIAPVPLNLNGLDRQLVGLGSYIVNGQGGCNDCHTNPPFLAVTSLALEMSPVPRRAASRPATSRESDVKPNNTMSGFSFSTRDATATVAGSAR